MIKTKEQKSRQCRRCGSTNTTVRNLYGKRYKICLVCWHRVRKKHGDYRSEKSRSKGVLS